MATALYYRLKKMNDLLNNAAEHVRNHDLANGKPYIQKHYEQKIHDALRGLTSLHTEAKDIAETLHSIKKKSIGNVKALKRDLKAAR